MTPARHHPHEMTGDEARDVLTQIRAILFGIPVGSKLPDARYLPDVVEVFRSAGLLPGEDEDEDQGRTARRRLVARDRAAP